MRLYKYRVLFIGVLSFILDSELLSQEVTLGFDCRMECILPEYIDTIWTEYPIYAGPANKKVKFKKVKHVLQKGNNPKWVQRKVDGNCMPRDEEDCLVWSLEDEHYKFVEIDIVKNPKKVKASNLKYEKFITRRIYENTQVGCDAICSDLISKEVIIMVRDQLLSKGYSLPPRTEEFSREFRKALLDFQFDNDLLLGHLTAETFAKLGIIEE